MRTKRKRQQEANTEDADQLIYDYLRQGSETQRVKVRDILEEYIDGIENTGERGK